MDGGVWVAALPSKPYTYENNRPTTPGSQPRQPISNTGINLALFSRRTKTPILPLARERETHARVLPSLPGIIPEPPPLVLDIDLHPLLESCSIVQGRPYSSGLAPAVSI